MTIDEQIKKLSQEMGVSFSDTKMLVNSVVNSIQQDGAVGVYISGTDNDRREISEAYIAADARKWNQFVNTYRGNSEARELFNKQMIGILKP